MIFAATHQFFFQQRMNTDDLGGTWERKLQVFFYAVDKVNANKLGWSVEDVAERQHKDVDVLLIMKAVTDMDCEPGASDEDRNVHWRDCYFNDLAGWIAMH